MSFKKVITRFAPSPTGNLHIGNARTAILNWLYAKKHNGDFLLRIDDTDINRSKVQYEQQIEKDLNWLNISWKDKFRQSNRLDKYNQAKESLGNRLYECYETPEELETKRKILMAAGKPCVYDRAALSLSEQEKQHYIDEGRKPHMRFLLNREKVSWNDMVRGDVSYDLSNISDPVLIRNNGTYTYMLCSSVDDEEYNVSHVIRGEDHIVNTAVQKQLIEALNFNIPTWGHISLIFDKAGKISKRNETTDSSYLYKIQDKILPEALLSFLSTVGRSKDTALFNNIEDLINDFDMSHFSKSNTIYDFDQIIRMNAKLLHTLPHSAVDTDPDLWNLIQMNTETIDQIDEWRQAITTFNTDHKQTIPMAPDMVQTAITLCPYEFTEDSTNKWVKDIQIQHHELRISQIKRSIRLILTSKTNGPELHKLLHFLGREEIARRLNHYV